MRKSSPLIVDPLIRKTDYIKPEAAFSIFGDTPYVTFLDSSQACSRLGRYSFLGIDPYMTVIFRQGNIEIITSSGIKRLKDNPFNFLKNTFDGCKREAKPGSMPFLSGCAGYFSYDLRYFCEELPRINRDDLALPDFVLSFYDVIIAFDLVGRETYISSSGLPEADSRLRSLKARARLDDTEEIIRNRRYEAVESCKYAESLSSTAAGPASGFSFESGLSRRDYIKAVSKARSYIRDGDIYQVNLSQRIESDFSGDPLLLYGVLRSINPAPFSAYLDCGDFKVLSSSPERFVKIEDRYIETRPIKGTRPRGGDLRSDTAMRRELSRDEKERAEHVMIVDLERNDLGRICAYGTVRPSELEKVETYATVMHLVSTISGRLSDGSGIIECLANCFPGGSITGAPKVRAMEIIEELEPVKRGIYTGSIGYVDFSGDADLSIVIRTMVLKGRKAYMGVGGGIVWDSDPGKEYQETLDKAKALLEALNIVKRTGAQVTGAQ